MYRERQKELNKVKDFVNQNYLKMLPEGKKDIKQIEPSKEDKKEEKKEQNEKKNSNIIADFTIKEEEKTQNKYNNNNNNEEEEEEKEIKIEEIPSNGHYQKSVQKRKKLKK